MQIHLKNLRFVGHHGLYEDERQNGRDLKVSLSVKMPTPDGVETDRIDDTLDYRDLAAVVTETSGAQHCDLLEHLGQKILDNLFDQYPLIRAARVSIDKKATGIEGDPEWVGIELSRTLDAH